MTLVLGEDQKPISGEEGKDSTIIIVPQGKPTNSKGAMTSDRMSMSLQVRNNLYQMSNKL